MAQRLSLIRHTQPAIEKGICYGRLDLDLAPSFPEEAAQTLEWMAQADLIITSPLQRAARLGEFLAAAQQAELRIDARLAEMHFGAWEGRKWDSIDRAELDAWAANLMDYAPPGGEPARELMARAQAVMHDIAALPQAHIAIVAHSGSLRAILAHLADIPLAATLGWDLSFGTVIGVRC